MQEPSKVPGCSGTRNLQDNLSDLKAQVAANKKVRVAKLFNYINLKYFCIYKDTYEVNSENFHIAPTIIVFCILLL